MTQNFPFSLSMQSKENVQLPLCFTITCNFVAITVATDTQLSKIVLQKLYLFIITELYYDIICT